MVAVADNGLGCMMYTIPEAEEAIKQAYNLTPYCPVMENGAYIQGVPGGMCETAGECSLC